MQCIPACHRTCRRVRRGFRGGATIAEVLVVIGILGILAAILLPSVQHARERSRQVSCRSNLRQMGIAAQAHQAATGAFPLTSVVSGDRVQGRPTSLVMSISPHRHLLAHLDPNLARMMEWEDPSTPVPDTPPSSISAANREVMSASLPVFLCPSDLQPLGGNNYRANMGKGRESITPPFISTRRGRSTRATARGRLSTAMR